MKKVVKNAHHVVQVNVKVTKIMRKEVLIDIETTGLTPRGNRITQIAAIYKKNGRIVNRFNSNSYYCLEEFKDYLDTIIDRFNKNDKAYFVAWNAKFDSEWMHEKMKGAVGSFGNYFYHMPIDIQQYCAYKFSRKGIIPENFKLETIARHFKIKCSTNKFHDAAYDINITNEILRKLWRT